MVNILFTRFSEPLHEALYKTYFAQLPQAEQLRNNRFVRWQDRHMHLLGKLLLMDALALHGFDSSIVNKIAYTANSKPFIKDYAIDFNISHSGNIAVCAISATVKPGIDIEEIIDINLSDFKSVLTPKEWEIINTSKNVLHDFFNLWTRKESVIKADGRGLQIPLNKIEVIKDSIIYDGKEWFIKPIAITENFAGNIALSKADAKLNVIEKFY